MANSKYVQTPYGTFLLKTFFSESLSTDSGEDVSSREVKRILQDAINEEDKKPLVRSLVKFSMKRVIILLEGLLLNTESSWVFQLHD